MAKMYETNLHKNPQKPRQPVIFITPSTLNPQPLDPQPPSTHNHYSTKVENGLI